MAENDSCRVMVLISAGTEWRTTVELFPGAQVQSSPEGDWFSAPAPGADTDELLIFFHGGWGKVSAAASTQYVIDRWSPRLMVNLGTCGGIAGEVEEGTILLVERTVIYDISDQMGDPAEALARYRTELDLSWLPERLPQAVRRSLLVSADRDLQAAEIPHLRAEYEAIAADWESGAIAWVANRNRTRCLILRGVSDIVSAEGGEAYQTKGLWEERAGEIMGRLIEGLHLWTGAPS